MTWTYTDPGTSTRDAVRFLCGDTNTSDQLITDEEIAYLVGQYPSAQGAAAAACRAIAVEFSRQADKQVGDLRISASQRANAYAARAVELDEAVSAGNAPVPFTGGVSIADKTAVEQDTDRVPPQFTRGGFTNPGGGEDDGSASSSYGVVV